MLECDASFTHLEAYIILRKPFFRQKSNTQTGFRENRQTDKLQTVSRVIDPVEFEYGNEKCPGAS